MATDCITWVRRGDTLRIRNPASLVVEPWFVLAACPDADKRWYCVTHNIHVYLNIGNLTMHACDPTLGETHEMALWCGKHRCYEAVNPPTGAKVLADVMHGMERP